MEKLKNLLISLREKCIANLGWVVLAAAGLVVASAAWPETRVIWLHDGSCWNGEATRSFGLALGALAGLYGLILAERRLKVSEDQAVTAESNLLNDRLKNGLAFLESESVETRCAGLLLLEQYAINFPKGLSGKETVVDILNAFLVRRAAPPKREKYEAKEFNILDWPELEETKAERRDLAMAIAALSRLVKVEERDYEGKMGFDGYRHSSLEGLDLRGLTLSYLELSFFNFTGANLHGAMFRATGLGGANFENANLEDTIFSDCDYLETSFVRANLKNSDFGEANFDKKTKFFGANLEAVVISDGPKFANSLYGADVSGATFWIRKSESVPDRFIFELERPPTLRVGPGKFVNNVVELGKVAEPSMEGVFKWQLGDNGLPERYFIDSDSFIRGTSLTSVWWKRSL